MLVSASHMVEGESYTFYSGNHCVTFVNQDIGNLLQNTLSWQKVFPSGTMDLEQLYHFNAPRHKVHPHLTTALSPELKLEQLLLTGSLELSCYHCYGSQGYDHRHHSVKPGVEYTSSYVHLTRKRQCNIKLQVWVLQSELYQQPRSPSHHVWTEGVCWNTIHTLFLNG
jgi:hypothetical protein